MYKEKLKKNNWIIIFTEVDNVRLEHTEEVSVDGDE